MTELFAIYPNALHSPNFVIIYIKYVHDFYFCCCFLLEDWYYDATEDLK